MSQRIKFTYNEAKSKCKDSGGKLAEPSENDNEELKWSFVNEIFKGLS